MNGNGKREGANNRYPGGAGKTRRTRRKDGSGGELPERPRASQAQRCRDWEGQELQFGKQIISLMIFQNIAHPKHRSGASIQGTEVSMSGGAEREAASPHSPVMKFIHKAPLSCKGRHVAEAPCIKRWLTQAPQEHTVEINLPRVQLEHSSATCPLIPTPGFPFTFLQRLQGVYPGMKILEIVKMQNSSANGYFNRDNDLRAFRNKFAPVTHMFLFCFSRVSYKPFPRPLRKHLLCDRITFFSHTSVFNFVVSPIHSYLISLIGCVCCFYFLQKNEERASELNY